MKDAAAAGPTGPEPRNLAELSFPLIAAVGIGCGVTVILITVFNYFVAPVSRELGFSTAQVTAGLSLHTAMLIVTLPLAGMLADRFGSRLVILVSASLYAACFVWISRVGDSVGEWYAAFAVAGLLGAGAGPVTYARVIVNRFTRHRGFALGVALTANGLAAIVLPQVVRPVVVEQGWRAGFLLLAGIVAVAGIVGAASAGAPAPRSGAHARDADGGLRGALATATFWKMALAFGVFGAAIAGMLAHLTEIFVALGLRAEDVPRFQQALGVATIAGRLIGGALMDRVPAKFVGAAAAALGVLGFALLSLGSAHGALIVVAAVAIGFCSGAESDVVSYLSSQYFGLTRFARVYAAQGSFFMIGFAGGPLAYALLADAFATTTLLLGGSALLLLSAAMLVTLQPPDGSRVGAGGVAGSRTHAAERSR